MQHPTHLLYRLDDTRIPSLMSIKCGPPWERKPMAQLGFTETDSKLNIKDNLLIFLIFPERAEEGNLPFQS